MTMTTKLMGAALISLVCAGCGDDGSGASESNDSTGAVTTGDEAPTSGDEGATDEGTTGGGALVAEDLAGRFVSGGCEDYPDGMGGHNYLTRDFTLTATTWHLGLTIFMDDACATPLFTAVVDGPYTLGAASATVAGATEGTFGFTTIVWTAHQEFMAETFNNSGCGAGGWVVGEAQDVTATGCIGVAHPVAECPEEYDVVALAGDDLFFGERVTDMCKLEGRPAALGAYPVSRQ